MLDNGFSIYSLSLGNLHTSLVEEISLMLVVEIGGKQFRTHTHIII